MSTFTYERRVELRRGSLAANPKTDYPKRWFPELQAKVNLTRAQARTANESYPERWFPELGARRKRQERTAASRVSR